MKATELMCGDIVLHHSNAYKVFGVMGKANAVDLSPVQLRNAEGMILGLLTCFATEIAPIPLTAEILEKNFPKADNVAWWYADDYEDADDRITYEIHISGGAIGINGFVWYVHELQHALRLCGLTDLADNFKI